jgi:xylulokinase
MWFTPAACREHHAYRRRRAQRYWRQMLADISGQQLDFRTGGDVGPALGAARLAQLALHQNIAFSDLLPQLPLEQAHRPMPSALLVTRPPETFRQIYQQLYR